MGLFSQRQGFRPLRKALQRESIDDELKNRLWSALKLVLWDKWVARDYFGHTTEEAKQIEMLLKLIWLHYFKLPLDTLPAFDTGYPKSSYQLIRERFFTGKWWEVFDFLEFVVKSVPNNSWKKQLTEFANSFLESENSAYRFVDSEIVEITDENEISTVESAIDVGIKGTSKHLKTSLEFLSDRQSPDYRNSIKESISAVESVCQAISGKKKSTLGDCLKTIKEKQDMHPAFDKALSSLYGYTSDEGGIRHALSEDSKAPDYADAKFMLVVCSAFVNFIWTKMAELNIKAKKPE